MSPTIRSIADAARVSRGTVDRVLNDRPGVSPEVRERVQALALDLGYKPNLAGRSLALHKNPLRIGFLLHHGRDPLFREMREGVDAVAAELADFGVQVDCRVMERVTVAERLRCLRALGREPLAGLALCPVEDPAVATEVGVGDTAVKQQPIALGEAEQGFCAADITAEQKRPSPRPPFRERE